MARRTMTLRRIDPWSVLKFGFVVNLCAAVVFLLGFAILWFVIGQLGIIDQACQLAEDVGFEDCGVDGGAVFRLVLLFAALAAVIMTGIAVFGAFLHNLLAELIGGIEFTLVEEGGAGTMLRRERSDTSATTVSRSEGGSADESGREIGRPPPRPEQRTQAASRDENPGGGQTQATERRETGGGSSDRGDDAIFGSRDQRGDQGWQG